MFLVLLKIITMKKSNNSIYRSKCPISCALDVLGDKWSLLIIRDMVHAKKKTFKEFFASEENIATNILSSRLKRLEKVGIISKNKILINKKTNIYKLTKAGLELIPTMLELTRWSYKNIKILNSKNKNLFNFEGEKKEIIKNIEHDYLQSFK